MQQAAIPGYKLSKAKWSTRVLTTFGLVAMFIGLLCSALLTLSKTGFFAASVSEYYLGTPTSGGLDDLLAASSPRPFAELAEVTHLHLVGGTMLLFLLCHLLSVCELSEKLRVAIYSISFTSFIVTFSLPWLIVYASPVFSFVFGPAISIFIGSLFVLTLLPLKEMWGQA